MAVYDVFLSYRRSDGSDLAKDLYQKLQRVGLRVFFDQSEMVDGHYFNTQISAALKQAPNYLLVATPEVFPFRDEAQESDWVKKEIELAFEFTLPSLGVSTMLSLLLFHVPLSSYLGLVECQLFPSEPKDMVSTSFASMLFRLSHAATE